MKRTLVFDIDDTICTHTNRDYVNAKPHWDVIGKINSLYKKGYNITLYTARGQNSCNGDLKLILERNEDILINWLEKHEVKYNELIFGKPLGNWYIDDKAMTVETFLEAPFEELIGNSGATIYRESDRVIKKGIKVKKEYEWYKGIKRSAISLAFKIPKIYSFTVDTLIMEYVDGPILSKVVNNYHLEKLNELCLMFKHRKDGYTFDVDAYIKYLYKCIPHYGLVKGIASELLYHKEFLEKSASFCHGDFTLNNIIYKDREYYLIDPGPKEEYSSYLLDLAKTRYSLSGFEKMFDYTTNDLKEQRDYFDILLKQNNLYDIVRLLEITRWIRIIPFMEKLHKDKLLSIRNKIEELWREYNEK